MSYPALCFGCELGDHARHVRHHGIRSGLIGGTYCPCAGDCKPPHLIAAEIFTNVMRAAFIACRHCGQFPEADGDHSCPCPHSDALCPDHPGPAAVLQPKPED